jgi:Protein of unknown function (DUF1761)
MGISHVNFLAVVVAALTSFLIGGLWYSRLLFGTAWMKESGMNEERIKQGNRSAIFGTTFILALIIALNLAVFLQGPPNLAWGMTAGALAGIGWVAAAMGITYLFEQKSGKLFLINAGYHVVTFTIMGAILGAWK